MIFYAHICTLFGVPLVSLGPAYWGYLWPIIFAQKAVRRLIFSSQFLSNLTCKISAVTHPSFTLTSGSQLWPCSSSFLVLFSNLSFISKAPITLWWCSFCWLWCVRHPVSCGQSPNGIVVSTSISISAFTAPQSRRLEFYSWASFLSWLLTANALSSPCSQWCVHWSVVLGMVSPQLGFVSDDGGQVHSYLHQLYCYTELVSECGVCRQRAEQVDVVLKGGFFEGVSWHLREIKKLECF